jgi:hypothetical protein
MLPLAATMDALLLFLISQENGRSQEMLSSAFLALIVLLMLF